MRREADSGADILVNNAGAFAFGPTADRDVASFEQIFDVNVRGTFFLTAALAPKTARRGGGSIVNISTIAVTFVASPAASYATGGTFHADAVASPSDAAGSTLTEPATARTVM